MSNEKHFYIILMDSENAFLHPTETKSVYQFKTGNIGAGIWKKENAETLISEFQEKGISNLGLKECLIINE